MAALGLTAACGGEAGPGNGGAGSGSAEAGGRGTGTGAALDAGGAQIAPRDGGIRADGSVGSGASTDGSDGAPASSGEPWKALERECVPWCESAEQAGCEQLALPHDCLQRCRWTYFTGCADELRAYTECGGNAPAVQCSDSGYPVMVGCASEFGAWLGCFNDAGGVDL